MPASRRAFSSGSGSFFRDRSTTLGFSVFSCFSARFSPSEEKKMAMHRRMPGTVAPNAGFTSGKPWFVINGNYKDINVESQLDDPNSILNFYRDALQFRRDNPVVIYGDYVEHLPKSKELYVYERNLAGKKLLVVCSYSEKCVRFDAPEGITLDETKQVFGNYDSNFVISNGFTTRPYEMRVYLF